MSSLKMAISLLLASALVAGAYAQSTSGIVKWNCTCPYNRAAYQFDPQLPGSSGGTTATSLFPQACALPEKSCACGMNSWVVAPWTVLTAGATGLSGSNPMSPTAWYLSEYNGQHQTTSPKLPYFAGTVSRGRCCAGCSSNNQRNVSGVVTSYEDDGKKVNNCAYWMHYVPQPSSTGKLPSGTGCSSDSARASDACGYCIIFPVGSEPPSCNNGLNCSTATTPQYSASMYATVGKGCPGGKNDPHFVGAKGTHFDFNGVPDESFCLITDKQLQVNMKMRGYYDERTVGATVLKNGKAIRTWIKDLGIVWVDASGLSHKFKLWARDGKSQTRDEGLLGGMEIDGAAVPRMSVGSKVEVSGGLSVEFVGHEKQGGGFFDVDVFELIIPGMMTLEVKSRIAHPLLQTPEDAMAHLNVKFIHVEASSSVHGVLGQTFRQGRERRAMDYASLAHLLKRDIAADSALGQGFLDGAGTDYKTSDVLSTDCRYSAFGNQELPDSSM